VSLESNRHTQLFGDQVLSSLHSLPPDRPRDDLSDACSVAVPLGDLYHLVEQDVGQFGGLHPCEAEAVSLFFRPFRTTVTAVTGRPVDEVCKTQEGQR
jgi:hypothetical protein